MTFDELPAAVEELLRQQAELKAIIAQLDRPQYREYYTLRQACELKGVSFEVVRKRPMRYWPARGNSHRVINSGGRYSRMFHRSEVFEWLQLTEEEIDAQIRRESTGRKAS